MNKQTKESIIQEFRLDENDTGSTDVQIALLTGRISQLTAHMAANRHDFHTKRSLLCLVGQRRRLSAYMKNENAARYQQLITKLGLRK